MPRATLEGSPGSPSVRSMTPLAGVVFIGVANFEDAVVLHLGFGVTSSSSEDITCIIA